MENQTKDEKLITKLIFNKPEIVAKLLKENGYNVPTPLTLQNITEYTFIAIYKDGNISFAKALDLLIADQEYNNFAFVIPIAIAVVGAVAGGISSSNIAKKQRELQKAIAVAQLEQVKNLEEQKLRVYGEIERTKILADSILAIRQSLHQESTKRQANVSYYLISIGLGISLIYGTSLILKSS